MDEGENILSNIFQVFLFNKVAHELPMFKILKTRKKAVKLSFQLVDKPLRSFSKPGNQLFVHFFALYNIFTTNIL